MLTDLKISDFLEQTASGTPVSRASTCCVRSASRALASVGSPNASSMALVCRLCVPPSTAASAW